MKNYYDVLIIKMTIIRQHAVYVGNCTKHSFSQQPFQESHIVCPNLEMRDLKHTVLQLLAKGYKASVYCSLDSNPMVPCLQLCWHL